MAAMGRFCEAWMGSEIARASASSLASTRSRRPAGPRIHLIELRLQPFQPQLVLVQTGLDAAELGITQRSVAAVSPISAPLGRLP
jgi:hypothetical protein